MTRPRTPIEPQPNLRMLTNYEIEKLAEAIVRKMGKPDRLMNTKEVAQKLGITETGVRTRCSRGQIPFHQKHGTLYFSENEINEYYLTD